MSEESATILKQLYDELNKGNIDVFASVLDDNMVEHEELPGGAAGKEGVIAFFRMVKGAFPDFQLVPEHVVADGDIASAFVTMTGTNSGEFMGQPATGKTVSIHLSDWMRIHNGKIVEHWGVMDSASLMQQLGFGAP